jgi:DNA-binding Lrp family transcriptional regulator
MDKTTKRESDSLAYDPRFSIELIASKLGCSPEDVQAMLRQWAGK